MANRIKKDDLDRLAHRLNTVTGNPLHWCNEEGEAVGHFHFENGYGGYRLCQTTDKNGGTRNVLNTGYLPARTAFDTTSAYIAGIKDIKYGTVKFIE